MVNYALVEASTLDGAFAAGTRVFNRLVGAASDKIQTEEEPHFEPGNPADTYHGDASVETVAEDNRKRAKWRDYGD